MAKIDWTFVNEEGTNLNRYKATNVSTNEEITFDLLRDGTISVVGTPLNATNMNSLIASINLLYDNKVDVESGKSLVSDTLITKLNDLPNNATLNSNLESKVDKIQGKGLSTNDYDNSSKSKVDILQYDSNGKIDSSLIPTSEISVAQAENSLKLGNQLAQSYKDNDNKSLYNLGNYDTINGNVITRQTGYLSSEWLASANWTYQSSFARFYAPFPYLGVSNNIIKNFIPTNISAVDCDNENFFIYTNITDEKEFRKAISELTIQYKLSTSYEETIINSTPLLNLDNNGCSFLREEWKKGINLLKPSGTDSASSQTITLGKATLKKGTYSIIVTSNENVGQCTINIGNSEISSSLNLNEKLIFSIDSDYENSSVTSYFNSSNTGIKVTLNVGSILYPYTPYAGDIVHKGELENGDLVVSKSKTSNNTLSFLGMSQNIYNFNLSLAESSNIKSYLQSGKSYDDIIGMSGYLELRWENGFASNYVPFCGLFFRTGNFEKTIPVDVNCFFGTNDVYIIHIEIALSTNVLGTTCNIISKNSKSCSIFNPLVVGFTSIVLKECTMIYK